MTTLPPVTLNRTLNLTVCLALLGAFSCNPASAEVTPTPAQKAVDQAPEIATAYTEKTGSNAHKQMVAAANPLAADAGYQMLRQGGSAIDAAIATQLVLTLVEPQSSGIGGGAFLMYTDGRRVQAFDGRETAPAAASEQLFQNPDGTPVSRATGVVGGRSVGAPGVLRMLQLAHREHGRLEWATLFAPAIALAQDGFPVSQRLHGLLAWDQALKRDPVAAHYFYDRDGKPWPVGHILKNPALARTLQEVADGGADAFYQGRIARDIAVKVASHPTNPGKLTMQDIAGYRAIVREPVCSDYKAWTVCGMPPPSSGGVAIAQMLGMLEVKDIAQFPPVDGMPDTRAIHLFAEAGRLAYADRDRYIADPDFVPLPGQGVAALVDKTYLAQRAALIGEKSMGRAAAGSPPGLQVAWGTDNALQRPSTSHLVVVDQYGAGLSMTTSVEDAFGARQMVDGFLLNNQLTDFSFASRDASGPVANRVQAGKRPRSAMSPTLVFEKGTHKLVLATGSPGGSAIINYVAKVLVGTMDWGLNVQQAISLPNFGSRNGPTELEKDRIPASQIAVLQAMGHTVRVTEQNSGLQGIMRLHAHGQDFWFGGADPRREGAVRGD
ncbi:gamma-glutamyltransferase [Janthinobacterium aquaticum]|uniref:gamma-glutamyltransferase n=1 Tax=Janthinobacterium sp. FT58W TaxID=2654254 RepID=UPI0012652732|nr:gamma-glutamyltransferase [Janthinobacterium sp. FT58W]KAB8041438.1 gamma-glutamyltransferase [Janthinobacterium sp. FT58W]